MLKFKTILNFLKNQGLNLLFLALGVFCLFNIFNHLSDSFTLVTNSLSIALIIYYFIQFERESLKTIKVAILNIKWPFSGKTKKILINIINFIFKKRWEVISYLFLFLLLIITLGNFSYLEKFIDLSWVKKYQTTLSVLAITFGGLTFWHNRERIEQETETEQDNESLAEQKRKIEFPEKFPNISRIPIVRNFMKWMYKEERKYSVSLLLIIIFGFIFRFLGAIWGNINLDEGIHLYDAKLITEGFTPFLDYFTREPYYIYSLSLLVKIFGSNLLTSRLFSVVASTLTIFIVYLLGKNIFSKKIGFIAAILFSLSPFIIYETYLGNLYGVYPLIMGLVFLSFSNLFKNPNNKTTIASGFLLGMAVNFYRLTVFYFPLIGIILGIITILKNVKIRHLGLFYLSTFIPFFAPIIYFSLLSGYNNFEIIYGTNELIIAFFSLPVGLLVGIISTKFWQKHKEKAQIITFCFFLLLITFSIYSFFNIGIQSNYKAKILFDALLQSWHLLFFVFIALIIYLKKSLFTNLKLSFTLKVIILGIMLCLCCYGTSTAQNLQNFGARIIPLDLKNIFLFFYSLSIVFLLFLSQKLNFKLIHFRKETLYWWLLFFAPLTFYLIHVQIQSSVFLSFVVLGCVMASLGFNFLTKIFQTYSLPIKINLIIMLIIFLSSPIYLYLTIPLRDRMWPQEARTEVGNYIKKNTKEGEEIFTNAIPFVVENNRKAALNLSRSTIYANNPVYMPDYTGTAKNLVSSQQLASYIKNNINLILIDNRTVSIFQKNKDFTNIKQYYYLDKKWPQYEIEAWKKY